MPLALEIAALNLGVAMACGAIVGSERQIRGRMAGLRTNALVSLGAASFVVFAGLYPDEISPTRVAAQIVSGIGFLGAGIIFREGMNVHGLNTAATLWCSAAVGMMAGSGAWPFALLLTGLVVFVNLGLRPLVKWIKRRARPGTPQTRHMQLRLTVPAARDAQARALILRILPSAGLRLAEISATPATSPDGQIDLTATVTAAEALADVAARKALKAFAAEPGLLRVQIAQLDDG